MNTRALIAVLILVVLIAVGYQIMNAPDQRSTGEKIGDAVGKLDEGLDDAGRELEDRTPGERIKDEINDATDGSPD